MSAPAEVLGELSKTFWAGLQEKKWLLRKESLTTLKDLANKPRLAAGDYGDVIRELKKVKNCLISVGEISPLLQL